MPPDPDLQPYVRYRHLLQSNNYKLTIIQQPQECRALASKERSRGAKWPLDPPPVLELALEDHDPHHAYLHSPFWFCTASLDPSQTPTRPDAPKGLVGTTVSSLHKVKLSDSKERGFFVFGDLNIRNPGTHRLTFSLFEMRQGQGHGSGSMVAEMLASSKSQEFKVLSPKGQLAVRESTQLSRQLCEAGVKLRIRKDTSNKRRPPPFEWSADKSQVLQGVATLSRAPMMGAVPTLPYPATSFAGSGSGVDVRNRLSVSNERSSLGIRQMMDQSLRGPESGMRTLPLWQTSQSPAKWPTTTYACDTAMPAYTMAPHAQNFELRSVHNPHLDSGYQSGQYTSPTSYTMPADGQNHSTRDNLQSSDSYGYMPNHHYGHMVSESGTSGPEPYHGPHASQFDLAPYAAAVGMATGGSDPGALRFDMGSRNMPLASSGPDSHQYQ